MPVGWDRGVDRASNDADVSSIPPNIPDCGFSPVRLKGWRLRRDLPDASTSLSLLPACADLRPVCLRPSCISWSLRWSALPSVPLAGTPRFHRTAAYTRCLRCTGAPRRPASGSELSLLIPSCYAHSPSIVTHRGASWPEPLDIVWFTHYI